MVEIKLHELTETLYNIVGDKIREFCENTYYGDIVFSFEQSYDGKEWTKGVEFASFENGTDLCYKNDWHEGQTHLRNLQIWHLEDSEPIKRGRWIFAEDSGALVCGVCGAQIISPNPMLERHLKYSKNITIKFANHEFKYCYYCGAKLEVEE